MNHRFSSLRVSLMAIGTMVASAVLLSACNKFDNDDNNIPVAGVIAFNLAPDVSSASFTLSGNVLTTTPLAYGNYTGGYLEIFTGARDVQAYASGTSLTGAVPFTFEANKLYSLFLVGANSNYRTITVQDKLDDLVTSDQAYIRYINAIPDSSQPAVTIASNGTNVVNDNADFAQVSEFRAVNAGDVVINVTNGGTIDANRTITLEQRKVYTVLLSGIPGTTGSTEVEIKYITNGTLD